MVVPLGGPVGLTTNAVMHGEPMHSGIQDTWVRDVRCTPHPRMLASASVSPSAVAPLRR
jgi:hypothetical protein